MAAPDSAHMKPMTDQQVKPAGHPSFGELFRENFNVPGVILSTTGCAAISFCGLILDRISHGSPMPSLLWFIPTLAVFGLLEVGILLWHYHRHLIRRRRREPFVR